MGRAASRHHISHQVGFFGPQMAHAPGENSVLFSLLAARNNEIRSSSNRCPKQFHHHQTSMTEDSTDIHDRSIFDSLILQQRGHRWASICVLQESCMSVSCPVSCATKVENEGINLTGPRDCNRRNPSISGDDTGDLIGTESTRSIIEALMEMVGCTEHERCQTSSY